MFLCLPAQPLHFCSAGLTSHFYTLARKHRHPLMHVFASQHITSPALQALASGRLLPVAALGGPSSSSANKVPSLARNTTSGNTVSGDCQYFCRQVHC